MGKLRISIGGNAGNIIQLIIGNVNKLATAGASGNQADADSIIAQIESELQQVIQAGGSASGGASGGANGGANGGAKGGAKGGANGGGKELFQILLNNSFDKEKHH